MKKFLNLAIVAGLLAFCPVAAHAGYDINARNLADLDDSAQALSSVDSDSYFWTYDISAGDAELTQGYLLGYPGRGHFVICGEATTINNNTVYYGPDIDLTADSSTGLDCDIDAVGNTTEATADAPAYTNKAVHVLGMTCRNEGDANAAISFTLRTAAGATVPSVTCSIADGERDCVADVQTTTIIAAGATVAVAGASSSNVGDNNGFVCSVDVAF